MSKTLLVLSFGCGLAVAATGWLLWPQSAAPRSASELMDVVMWNSEPIGGTFSLTDHNGQPRSDADFRGKLLMIYFGFTFCSDVCPTDLQSMASALDKLGAAGERVQPLFITLDPERDTPAQLKAYVNLIHPRLIGLTGRAAEIKGISTAYKVYYSKTTPTRRDNYEIDHTGFIFLVSPAGQYLGFLPPGTSAERMVDVLRPQLAALPQS